MPGLSACCRRVAARDQVRLRTGLQREKDDMGLLLRIGADCAGALSVLPDGMTPAEAAEPIRALTEDDIRSLVHFAGWPLPVPVRFALAGAQHKLAVIHGGDGKYAPPGYLRPSGHILKFETMNQVCFAEHIATVIAGEAGLPVVKTDYLQAEYRDRTTPYLRMARYDRAQDEAGNVSLLHQEDMLQALRLHPMYKYQSQNGPSIRIIAELLRAEVMSPERDLASLADWQILNYLLGNWDGHAKNLSLLYQPGREAPVLAPFYDIVSIEYLNVALRAQFDRSMAFAVGESHTPERITRADWEKMAADLGLSAGPAAGAAGGPHPPPAGHRGAGRRGLRGGPRKAPGLPADAEDDPEALRLGVSVSIGRPQVTGNLFDSIIALYMRPTGGRQ